ncbi:MAG: S-layer homology domain-containing protein [Anaerovorax sp.]
MKQINSNNRFRRILAFLLTFSMVAGSLGLSAFGTETTPLSTPPDLKTQADTLIQSIAKDIFDKDRLTQSMSSGSDFVIALYGAKKGDSINHSDKANFLAKVLNEARDPNTGVGALAKHTIALTAMGIDPTQIPTTSGSSLNINLIDQLDKPQYSSYGGIYSAPYVLMAYNLGYDDNATKTAIKTNIIQYIYDEQSNPAYFAADSWGTPATDKVAMAAAALAPHYATNPQAKTVIDATITWLSTQKKPALGFGNANSDATVILAMASLMKETSLQKTCLPILEDTLTELLSFQLTDGTGFDFMANTPSYYNPYATMQGLQALVAYSNYAASGNGNLFDFSPLAVSPYQNWPEGKFPLEIFVKPPTKTIYPLNDPYGYLDTTGIEITAKFSDQTTQSIPLSLCSMGWLDNTSVGAKTISVNYLGKSASFIVQVEDSSSGNPSPTVKKVTISIERTAVSNEEIVIEEGITSVLDVLKTVTSTHNISMSSDKGYISEIKGYKEFGEGPNSGWLYKVNGVTPPTTAPNAYKLKGGESINWYYTTDYTHDSSSSNWNTENLTVADSDQSISTVTMNLSAKTDGTGHAIVSLNQKDILSAIAEAEKAAAKSTNSKKTQIKLAVSLDTKATSLGLSISKNGFCQLGKTIDQLAISSSLFHLTLPKSVVKSIGDNASADIMLTAKKIDGARPTYDFFITNGSLPVADFKEKVTIQIPYTPNKEEDTNALVIYDQNKDQKDILLQNGHYDSKTKSMNFSSNHFSQYMIGYHPVSFTDMQTHWAKDSISYLAARDMVSGKSSRKFFPNDTITRAEFITILANQSGADLHPYETSQFKDVRTSDWFYKGVAWAATEGIITGSKSSQGTFIFQPNAPISRQDMAVILDEYEKKIEKVTLPSLHKSVAFTDERAIFAYAKESVSTMQKAGIINGLKAADGSYSFNPKGNATRGEAGKMIASMMALPF